MTCGLGLKLDEREPMADTAWMAGNLKLRSSGAYGRTRETDDKSH